MILGRLLRLSPKKPIVEAFVQTWLSGVIITPKEHYCERRFPAKDNYGKIMLLYYPFQLFEVRMKSDASRLKTSIGYDLLSLSTVPLCIIIPVVYYA